MVVDQAKAEQLFAMMRDDVSLTEVKKKEKAAKSKQAALLKGTEGRRRRRTGGRLNGGGRRRRRPGDPQLAAERAGRDQVHATTATPPRRSTKTTLEYAPNQADQARALAEMMGLPAAAHEAGHRATPRGCRRWC